MKHSSPDINLLPPQAIEIESAVLGSVILSGESFSEISGILKADMFYVDNHGEIFSVIERMANAGRKIDLLTVTQSLKDFGLLEKVGGPVKISELVRPVASAAHIKQHAQIVFQKYIQRRYIKLAAEISKKAYDNEDPGEISELFNQFEADFESMAAGTDSGSNTSEALKIALDEIVTDNEIIKSGKKPGIESGFKQLDEITGGFRPGQLVVVGARPGMGKTSLALYFARNAAKQVKKVLFFSLEMLKADLLKILLAAETEISRVAIRDGILHEDNWNTIRNTLPKLQNLSIHWIDIPGININQLTALVKYHKRRGGVDLIVIDYLQLIQSGSKIQFREQEVSAISRALKALSLSLQIPVIVNSQLNRLADGERPKLSHLRESGSIEQDADIVLLPWRPGYIGFENKSGQPIPEDIGEIVIAKNRRGPRGTIEFRDLGQMLNFKEIESTNF